MKKIKKISKNLSKKVNSLKPVQVPLLGVILFCLLLAGTSFFAGVSWLKMKGDTITQTDANTFAVEKDKKPEFNFYVMSFCPYGNQIEEAIKPVAELIGDQADIHPRYIFDKIENLDTYCKQTTGDPDQCNQYVTAGYFTTEAECKDTIVSANNECLDESQYLKIGDNLYSSLHGRVEANQNIREICAYNMLGDDKSQWWTFIDNVNQSCDYQNADTCWEEQAKKANLDTNKITDCFNNQAGELIEKEIALTTEYQVQGSPTLIINGTNFPPETAYTQDGTGTLKIGKEVFGQDEFRNPNTIKAAVCEAFKKAPKECKTELEEVNANAASEGGC